MMQHMCRLIALSLVIAGVLACSSTPNYGAACAGDGDCTGGLDCVMTSCGGTQQLPMQCTQVCHQSNDPFGGCPSANSSDDRLVALCDQQGISCDGGTFFFCKVEAE